MHTTGRQVSKSNSKLGPRIAPAPVTVSRSEKPQNATGTTLSHPIRHLHLPHQNTLIPSFRMTAATEVPDSACLNANAICSSEKFFFPIRKTHPFW